MSVSTLESLDSANWLASYQAEADMREKLVQGFRAQFLQACAQANGSMPFGGGTRIDYTRRLESGHYARRPQVLADELFDAMDHADFVQRAMQIVLSAAAGRGTQRDAQQLLQEVAGYWAEGEAEKVL